MLTVGIEAEAAREIASTFESECDACPDVYFRRKDGANSGTPCRSTGTLVRRKPAVDPDEQAAAFRKRPRLLNVR